MSLSLILAFIVYFGMLLAVGIIFHTKQTSSAEFVMGNRSLNFWLVALSAHASDMSAWLFMAFPMVIFLLGIGQIWIAGGLLVGMFLNWQFVAPKLRVMTEYTNSYTLPSFFEKRFKDTSGIIRILSAVVMLIFLVHYLSACLIAMGALLESLFGIEYMIGLSIAMVIVVIYTFLGGFTTVAWTDFFQAVFLLLMIILVPVVAYIHVGGWDNIIAAASQKNIPLTPPSLFDLEATLPLFLLALGWSLGYFGMPQVITKFMGIKDASQLNKSKWLGMSWQMMALTAATAVGVVGIAFFPEGLSNPELVFIEMVKMLFHPFLGGIILCAIIAANMSTMDSQILVCASIMSEDLYRHFFKGGVSDKKVLAVSQFSVIAVSFVALLLAADRSATILETVSYAWSGLGASFGPLVLMSLYSNKVTRSGAVMGLLTGCLIVMVWPVLNPKIMSLSIMPMIPGFFGSLAVIYGVSKLTYEADPVKVK
jgi:solute:Na+ symporter, SSS family